MANITPLNMVMTGGWFMALFTDIMNFLLRWFTISKLNAQEHIGSDSTLSLGLELSVQILNHVLNPYSIGPKIRSEVQIIGAPGKRTWGCRMGSSMQLIKIWWNQKPEDLTTSPVHEKVTPPKLGLQSQNKWAVKYQTLITIEPPNNRYILVVGVPGGKHSPCTWL